MAILRDLVELDHKLTRRSKGMLNTRALRARDAEFLPLKGHGTSAAHYTSLETAAYLIGSLTTFVKASEVHVEIPAFSNLRMTDASWQTLVGNDLWHLEDGNVPRQLNQFQLALSFLIELAGDPKRLNSKGWKAIDRKYTQGDLTLRKSVDTREAIITLVPKAKNAHPLHIEYRSSPIKFTVDCPVFEAVTVPLSFVAEFGALLAGNGDG